MRLPVMGDDRMAGRLRMLQWPDPTRLTLVPNRSGDDHRGHGERLVAAMPVPARPGF